MDNLDLKCAGLGQELAGNNDVSEKLLTDALGVLEEQGLYAAFLYFLSRSDKDREAANQVLSTLYKTLNEIFELPEAPPTKYPESRAGSRNGRKGGKNHDRKKQEHDATLSAISKLSKDLDDLLLARELVRQALVYGRYHIKARGQ